MPWMVKKENTPTQLGLPGCNDLDFLSMFIFVQWYLPIGFKRRHVIRVLGITTTSHPKCYCKNESFYFDGKYDEHTDGGAIGPPLSPLMAANLYTEHTSN